MRWRNFLYSGLLALFGIPHSALASFEAELKKLGNYDIIYDSSNSLKAPFFIKASMFPDFSISCTGNKNLDGNRNRITRVGDEINVEALYQNSLGKVRLTHEPTSGWRMTELSYNGVTYSHDNEAQSREFELVKSNFKAIGSFNYAEVQNKIFRQGVQIGREHSFSKALVDAEKAVWGERFPSLNVEGKEGFFNIKKLIRLNDRFLLHIQSRASTEIYQIEDIGEINENDSFSSSSSKTLLATVKTKSNELKDLASGAFLIRQHTYTIKDKTGKEVSEAETIRCEIDSKIYNASELGIQGLVKEANAKRDQEAARIAKLEKQRLEEGAKRERERLAALELERLKELERKRKEEILRKEKEKEQALETARRLQLERERKQKEEQKRRAKELAQQEKKRKEIANAKRLAEIERKLEKIKTEKYEAAKLKHRDAIAVIIGNRDYEGRIPDVDYAGNDADAMRDFVLNKLGYRSGNIIDLRDASKARLEETFGSERSYKGRLFDYVRADESDVIVFYSGHGVPGMSDKRGYLLSVDANPNRAELTGYPVDTLLKNLSKIPAKSMTVFIDACFSGDSPKGMIVKSMSGLMVEIRQPKKTSSKMVVLTASRGDEAASWDEEAKHGLFTKHLLEALNGAADKQSKTGNKDGKVTLGEVKAYLDREMTYQARRRFSRDQHATVSGDLKTVLSAY